MKKGDYLGEIGFFTNMERTASVQSVYFTDLFYLSRRNFLKLLCQYPHDLVIYFQFKYLGKIFLN
jgi:CRP-like cAMP-binding protein